MKLLTHNLLMCNKKGCTINNFPLKIKVEKSAVNKFEFDSELIKRTLKKIDLPALTQACKDMSNYKFDFESLTPEDWENKEILEYVNHILFELVIQDGYLVCNNCGKEYKVYQGIPNMVLNDDEV